MTLLLSNTELGQYTRPHCYRTSVESRAQHHDPDHENRGPAATTRTADHPLIHPHRMTLTRRAEVSLSRRPLDYRCSRGVARQMTDAHATLQNPVNQQHTVLDQLHRQRSPTTVFAPPPTYVIPSQSSFNDCSRCRDSGYSPRDPA